MAKFTRAVRRGLRLIGEDIGASLAKEQTWWDVRFRGDPEANREIKRQRADVLRALKWIRELPEEKLSAASRPP